MPWDDRHEGVQRKVWLPEPVNTAVEKLAASQNQAISATLRELIQAGLRDETRNEAAVQQVTEILADVLQPLVTRVDHLERLIFFIAQNTAAERVTAEKRGEAVAQERFPDHPERAAEAVRLARGEIQMLVHDRIRKALRGRNPIRTELQGEEEEEEA
jgi:hypothetical protein